MYQVKHKSNSISTSSHVLFCLLYKHTDDRGFTMVLCRRSGGVFQPGIFSFSHERK